MILLKNGTYTKDPRLTRIPHFDDRSRMFPVTAAIEATKPRSYTWSCSLNLDQGVEGACVSAAFAHELAAKPSVVRGLDMTFAREKIYWEAQKMDPWPGGSYPGATPAYEGTTVLAGAKVVQRLGYIKEYRWAFGMNDLIMAVGHKGPAVLGIDWHEGMYSPDQFGFINADGAVVGGHAILCKGVNVAGEYFILHNSWGPAWGNKGECKISWDDMDYLLRKGGECCVPVTRKTSQVGFFQDVFNVFKGMFK